MNDVMLFSGSSNPVLAQAVSTILGIPLGGVDLTRFADGEIRPWIRNDVRGKTVFVMQSLSNPMDEHIMELVLMGDAIRRSAPKNVIAVIPYMGYARQDKQHRIGEPVSARVIAKFIEVSKFKEVIAVDLHNDAIVGFFSIPVNHISALPVLIDQVKRYVDENTVVVSPDVGGVKRARNLAFTLDVPLVVMEKKRYLDKHDQSEAFQIIGDVEGKTAIVIDDIISTGGTLANGAVTLRGAGASKIIVLASHAVFAGNAVENLKDAPIDAIIVTDTIAQNTKHRLPNLQPVTVAPLIAKAIGTIAK